MRNDSVIAVIVQARRGSSRLPDKVMKNIVGRPMLYHVLERVKRAGSVSRVCLATTTSRQDKILAGIAAKLGVETFFGSETDVLDRYYGAAKRLGAKDIVRITADCPLMDPSVIDKVVSEYLKGRYDYASNIIEPTFPDGLDVEVFSFRALERAWKEARLKSEREHVTPYIWKNPNTFRLKSVKNKRDLSDHRWTVDHVKDLEFARQVYRQLYTKDPQFGYADVLSLLKRNPEITSINKGTSRNEGYRTSLAQDKSG
jgi:spore coat polysaccharide biosynthesis protein SpsF